MPNSKMLCLYYPTTVVIVDDNKTFLENLPDNLSTSAAYKLYDSPLKALDFLNNQQQHLPNAEDFFATTDDLVTGVTLNVNIPKIHHSLHNKHRHDVPTVIIVDYDMPEMTGIEFCRKLIDHPIKKIMLTGEADHKLAVQAFNDGIIHNFIAKDDPNVFAVIDKTVSALQEQHFAHLSEQITKNITSHLSSFLGNNAFHVFLENIIREQNIVEFYLIDPIGSFLLVNDKGELLRLVVQSSQEIENYQQTAKDHSAPIKIINALTNKEKLLCLFSAEDFNQPVEKWATFLHPANKATGIAGCYYTIIQH